MCPDMWTSEHLPYMFLILYYRVISCVYEDMRFYMRVCGLLYVGVLVLYLRHSVLGFYFTIKVMRRSALKEFEHSESL